MSGPFDGEGEWMSRGIGRQGGYEAVDASTMALAGDLFTEFDAVPFIVVADAIINAQLETSSVLGHGPPADEVIARARARLRAYASGDGNT